MNNKEFNTNNNVLVYVKENSDIEDSIKKILRIPSSILPLTILLAAIGILGLILIIIGIFSYDGFIFYLLGFALISMALSIFFIVLFNIFLHNGKVNGFIKQNVNEFRNELSGNFYYINDFKTYFTKNYLICNYFNKKSIIKYCDIIEISRESSVNSYVKGFNNQGFVHHFKNTMYDGLYNFVIKTNNKRKFCIPSPGIDSFIYKIVYSKNNNVITDIDVKQFTDQIFNNPSKKFCSECGYKLKGDSQYCGNCGKKIN